MQKSALVVLDEFEDLIDDVFFSRVQSLFESNMDIASLIKERSVTEPFYRQSISLFVAWLIKKRRSRLVNSWPLDMKIMNAFAKDLGVSLDDF